MVTRKGMSQILTLIVAASVLMMTGLTIIMMSQGALSGIFGTSNQQSCIESIKTTCQYGGTGPHALPASCESAGVSGADIPGVQVNINQNQGTYSCQ
jgi:hypothetical protein